MTCFCGSGIFIQPIRILLVTIVLIMMCDEVAKLYPLRAEGHVNHEQLFHVTY